MSFRIKYGYLPMEPGIYLFRNLVNGLVYVGSSKFIRKRVRQHLKCFREGSHYNERLQRDWKACGEDGFRIEVLWVGGIEELGQKEREFFLKFGLPDASKGYNRESYPYHPGKAQPKEVVAKRIAMLVEMRKSHPEWGKRAASASREARLATQAPLTIVAPDGRSTETGIIRSELARKIGCPPKAFYMMTGGTLLHVRGWALPATPRNVIYGPDKTEYSFVDSGSFKRWVGEPKMPVGGLLSGKYKTWHKWSVDPDLAGKLRNQPKARVSQPKSEPKPLVLFNINSGLLNTFSSRSEVCRQLGVDKSNLYSMLRGESASVKGWRLAKTEGTS